MATAHPAKFSAPVLDKINDLLDVWGTPQRTIDPFAGTGRVHDLNLQHSVGVEIEAEWALMHPHNIVADALNLPFPDGSFDGLVSSPCYGNRQADHHNAQDGSRRYSYTHTLGRTLHTNNAGTLQWGPHYRDFHDRAWTEALRVLTRDALIIVNVSNHIRQRKEQHVSEWHMNWFMTHGCVVLDFDVVPTQRLRYGANRERVRYENIFVLRYLAPVLFDLDDLELEELL
jgi:SAM-dependent methyltransferase